MFLSGIHPLQGVEDVNPQPHAPSRPPPILHGVCLLRRAAQLGTQPQRASAPALAPTVFSASARVTTGHSQRISRRLTASILNPATTPALHTDMQRGQLIPYTIIESSPNRRHAPIRSPDVTRSSTIIAVSRRVAETITPPLLTQHCATVTTIRRGDAPVCDTSRTESTTRLSVSTLVRLFHVIRFPCVYSP
jgi:hypothetical protein